MLLRAAPIPFLLLLTCAAPALAQDTRVSLRVSYFEQQDTNGQDANPFLNEDATVIEPVLLVEHDINEDVTVRVMAAHDYVSAASIERLDAYPTQSGASSDYYALLDFGVDARVSRDVALSGHVGGGFERDYKTFGGGGTIRWDLFDKNTTLSLGLAGLRDEVVKIRYHGINEGSALRVTFTLNLGWYQVLTPWLHGALGYTVSRQDGFLETNINAIVIEDGFSSNPLLVGGFPGTEKTEELPGDRLRHAFHGRIRGMLRATGSALELAGRLYQDSWSVSSWTVEVRLYQWLVRERLRLRVRYRHYDQEEARYYRKHYFLSDQGVYHRTQDPDLGDFRSDTLGGKLTWFINDSYRVDGAIEYVWRSDGLDQVLGSIGFRFSF